MATNLCQQPPKPDSAQVWMQTAWRGERLGIAAALSTIVALTAVAPLQAASAVQLQGGVLLARSSSTCCHEQDRRCRCLPPLTCVPRSHRDQQQWSLNCPLPFLPRSSVPGPPCAAATGSCPAAAAC